MTNAAGNRKAPGSLQEGVRPSLSNRVKTFVRRAGWWGTVPAVASLFFLLGGTISLFGGDFSVAVQSFLVSGLLAAAGVFIASRRSLR